MSQRALVITSKTSPATVQTIPIPLATSGSAIIQIIVTPVLPYARIIYDGTRGAPFPTPFVPGSSAVGRVASLGPDATRLKVGDLVLVDPFFHSRDAPEDTILFGYRSGPSPGSEVLISGEWRNGSYAEYTKVPLENCHRLSTSIASNYNYTPSDLAHMTHLLVPYGGLRDINLLPGETIIVAPATGSFGGGAVQVALAMGARVIVAGRNTSKLAVLKKRFPTLEIVQLSGEVAVDTAAFASLGEIDAFIDFCPPGANESTHFSSIINSIKIGGRISLMGGIRGDIKLPYFTVMFKSLQLRGKFMYERSDIGGLIKLVEMGTLKLGQDAGHESIQFELEEWDEAMTAAEEKQGYGMVVLMSPQSKTAV